MLSILNRTFQMLRGFARAAAARARGEQLAVTGKCVNCGRCCGRVSLMRGRSWIRSARAFEKLKMRRPEYRHFVVTGREVSGELVFKCLKLDENNLCSIYDGRPDFCRKYPSLDLHFMGGELTGGCGYRFETLPSFSKILRKAAADERRPPEPGDSADSSRE